MNKTLSIIILTLFFVSGCTDRVTVEQKNNYQSPKIIFAEPTIEKVGKLTFATKRSFNDFTGDGITDMFSLNDSTGIFSKQDYKGSLYEGYYDEQGILQFKIASNPKLIDIPFNIHKNGSFKLDSANVSATPKSDVIYTHFKDTRDGDFTIKFAINVGQNDDVNFVPIEEHYNNRDYYENGIGTLGNYIIEFVHRMQEEYYYDSEKGINDYLKKDWCDFDGNGLDDLILMWNAQNDLAAMIVYSSPYLDTLWNTYNHSKEFYIPEFLYRSDVSYLDTEDFDNDGVCEIILNQKAGNEIYVNIAHLEGEEFIPTTRQVLNVPSGLDLFASARKIDTLDRNQDGKSDIIFITEKDDQQVIITYYSDTHCPKGECF